MTLAQSKLTAQGQISVPAEVRKKLGIGPGSVLEWEEQSGQFVVRKSGRHNSLSVHRILFGGGAKALAPVVTKAVATKEGIRRYIHRRHARD